MAATKPSGWLDAVPSTTTLKPLTSDRPKHSGKRLPSRPSRLNVVADTTTTTTTTSSDEGRTSMALKGTSSPGKR
jgi:hypothetical protein